MTSTQSSAYDQNAEILEQRFQGQAQVRFDQDPAAREFDFVSSKYVGQAKPGGFSAGSSFRTQARETFQLGRDTGRQPYLHFDGQPHQDTIDLINRYSTEYGLTPVIDTKPLSEFQ